MTTLLDSFSKTFIGIEFRDDTIIFSCLKNDISGLKFLSSSAFPLKSDDETVAEINSFIAENVRGPRDVFVAVPHKWSMIKFIEIPTPKAKGKDALAHMMRFEIERHVPYAVEDIFFDFQVVSKSGSTYNVMAVAVHKDRIRYVQDFLDKFLLKPIVITISSFAILNSFECGRTAMAGWHASMAFARKSGIWGGKGESCITLFLENSTAFFSLLSDGVCHYTSTFDIVRDAATAETADDISTRISGILPEFSLSKADRILVSGMTGPYADLPDVLGEKMGTAVQVYNPLAKLMPGQEDVQSLYLVPSIGACSLGLDAGIIRINLLPHKTGALFRKTGALVSKVAIPLILLLLAGIFVGNIMNDRRILEKINSQIKEYEPEVKTLEKLISDINMLKKKRHFLSGVHESNLVLEVLSELTGLIPKDAWISNFHYKVSENGDEGSLKGELIISGFAQSSSILISILEDSLFFEKVEFVGPIKKRRGMEEFKIKVVTVRPALPGVPALSGDTKDRADAQ